MDGASTMDEIVKVAVSGARGRLQKCGSTFTAFVYESLRFFSLIQAKLLSGIVILTSRREAKCISLI